LVKNSAKISGQGIDFKVGQALPVGNARDGLQKEVGGKQAPLRYVFGCHALVVACLVVMTASVSPGWMAGLSMIVHYFDIRRAGCVLWPLEANQSRIIKFLDQTRVGDGSTGRVGKPAPGPRQPRRFFGSVEIDLDRPVKSFDAILNAVVMELQRTKEPR
jgi:hypothetical protein